MQLVIVESPAKAKTIEKYLGGDFKVLASYGHIRDLPPKDGSVVPDDGFAMSWEVYSDKRNREQVKAISDAAKDASRLVLATDPDREGEAISWHVMDVLKKRKALPTKVDRVTFNSITKKAVTEAMQAPRELDQPLIDAYLGRRALDYLFGFTLSPVLWRKLPGAKSAGRVQSVALRLIVEREREIEAFKPDEYWSVLAKLEQGGTEFDAKLVRYKGEKLSVSKDIEQRRLQKAFLRYHDERNWPMLREELKQMGRADLIGKGPNALIPAEDAPGGRTPRPGFKAKGRGTPGKGQKAGVKKGTSYGSRQTNASGKNDTGNKSSARNNEQGRAKRVRKLK